jgi:hypothetical protein
MIIYSVIWRFRWWSMWLRHRFEFLGYLVWKGAKSGVRWLKLRPPILFWPTGIGFAVLLFIRFSIWQDASWYASWYGIHYSALAPILTLTAGVVVAWVALMRHFAQTDADRQRRITESFSKAVEQLGEDKIEVRLGGVYSLERISRESLDDYLTVMENLTAFVRERSRRNEIARTSSSDAEQRVSRRAYFLWQQAGRPAGRDQEFWSDAVKQEELGEPPSADIAAVLTVIRRRSKKGRKRERIQAWHLDFSGAVLRQSDFSEAHLEDAYFFGADLKGANFHEAHLENARFAHADLKRANLYGAHLKQANFYHACLERAYFLGAHLERAHLNDAKGSTEEQFFGAHGDGWTWLPRGVARPSIWPPSFR